ncbi:MAG: FadR/GntR family transcriptional regulator [Pseudomonadales bacterium]
MANILRDRILTTEEGTYLGSEAELATEIGISLPTLRQAARMLEYEQLLKIKPGKGGGYFVRRPSIDAAVQSASQYLSSKDLVSNAMFMDCADPLVITTLEAAVACEDKKLIEELREFVENERGSSKNLLQPEASHAVSAWLMYHFGKMSGNTLLELFIRILWNGVSTSRTYGTFEGTEEIVRLNYLTRLRVAEAVLKQDREKAIKAWQRRSKFLRSWPRRGFHLYNPNQMK